MKFVIGTAGRFSVGDAVRLLPPTVGRNPFTEKRVPVGAYVRLVSERGTPLVSAPLRRGVAQEGPGFYARVLPEDAEEGLSELDQQIERKRAELLALSEQRQEYLAAHVVRGQRIGEKHATPHPNQGAA